MPDEVAVHCRTLFLSDWFEFLKGSRCCRVRQKVLNILNKVSIS